jgi:hypothetical protein
MVGSVKRKSNSTAERANIDDAALALAQEWEEGLSYRKLTNQIHLELPAQILKGQELERTRDGDTGIVDETRQSRLSKSRGYALGRRGDRCAVGYIKKYGSKPV